VVLWFLVEGPAGSHMDAIWVVAGVGLSGLLIAVWLASRLSRSVRSLTEQTKALAEGEPIPAPPRPGTVELEGLNAAITRLDQEGRGRLAEAERAASTLEVVLGALPQGTILIEADDAVAYANPSAYQLLGVIPDTLSGLAPYPFQSAVRECRESRSQVTKVVEHGRPIRILMAVATPFAEDRRALLVVVDMTERERASAVRRDFVANASHELKTPVSSIIASSEALQIAVARGDDSSARFAKQIEESAHQLDRLVTDLLDLSRLERDQPELDPVGLDLLVREEVERIRPMAEERGIEVDAETVPIRVAGSRRDLVIAFRNLLDNAIRYTGAGGMIRVRLGRQKGDAVLEVKDTGEGIPTRDLGRVFERFYRVDTARSRATGGTGLGLAIVKHVVESHGGRVEAESQLGVGSTFTVLLPVLEEEPQPAS
jgi:signal transduction histidine kinase